MEHTVVLLLLLILLYNIQKCFNTYLENMKSDSQSNKTNPNMYKNKSQNSDFGLMYGTTPLVIGSEYDINYMRYNNQNKLEIPNSKIALDRLMEYGSYNCRDNKISNSIINKKKIENLNKKKIANNTTLREQVISS